MTKIKSGIEGIEMILNRVVQVTGAILAKHEHGQIDAFVQDEFERIGVTRADLFTAIRQFDAEGNNTLANDLRTLRLALGQLKRLVVTDSENTVSVKQFMDFHRPLIESIRTSIRECQND